MVLDEVGQSNILSARFDISRTFVVKEVFAEWCAIGLLPTTFDGIENRLDLILVRVLKFLRLLGLCGERSRLGCGIEQASNLCGR